MVLLPTYSRRKKQAQGVSPDVYHYDRIPSKLRVQVIQIFNEAIGDYSEFPRLHDADPNDCYRPIVRVLRKEFGRV